MRHNKDRVLAALSTDRKEGKRKTERNKGKKASGLSYLRIPARFDGIELQDCPAAAVILPGFFNQDLDFFFLLLCFHFFFKILGEFCLLQREMLQRNPAILPTAPSRILARFFKDSHTPASLE